MKNRYLHRVFSAFALLLLVIPACKKEKINNEDNGYAIQLTVEKSNRNVILTWSETKNTNFEHYTILRSTSPIPDDPIPNGTVIATIDDYTQTSFEDATFPFTEFVYYKVYAKIGDRFLSSPTFKLENNVQLLDLVANRIVFDTQNDLVYLFDANKNSLYKYDYTSEKFLDTLSFPGVFDMQMAIGNHGNGNELYVATNTNINNVVRIYNADNFQQITTMNVNGSVLSIASGNNDLLYFTTDNWLNNFTVYKRSTKQALALNGDFPNNGDAKIRVISPDGLTVVSTMFNNIVKYKMTAQGSIAEVNNIFLQNSFFGSLSTIPLSNDGQFFVVDIIGTILDKELNFKTSLSTDGFILFSDLVFSQNNDKLWGFNANQLEMIEFSFPAATENKRLPLNYQSQQAELDGDQIIVVGSVFDGLGNKTIIDKLQVD